MYFTYILYSKLLDQYYTGQTKDLDIRLKEHNCGRNSATREGVPWLIVYFETFKTREDAEELETEIKKRGAKIFLQERDIATP